MKYTLLLSLLATSFVATSHATVTLGFYAAATGGISNLSTTAGVTGVNGLFWGVVVDGDGNGFDTGSWTNNWVFNTSLTGVAIPGSSGDLLFIGTAGNLTSTTVGGQGGIGGINQLANMNILGQATIEGSGNTLATVTSGSGSPFAIIWFESATLGGSPGSKIGLLNHASFKMPSDGSSVNFGPNFAGADPVRNTTISLVPEPSAALLGAFGVLGLLRRRRI